MERRVAGYRKLIVYQRMMELVLLVYKLTKQLPAEEKYGLTSQMRRAVVSVISNFAEGYLKKSAKEKAYFLEMSFTSLVELEVQGEVCEQVGYWSLKDIESFFAKTSEVNYLLDRYREKVV